MKPTRIVMVTLFVYLVILSMCVYQMVNFSAVETKLIQADSVIIPQKPHIALEVRGSHQNPATMRKLDSVMTAIDTWNKACDEKIVHGLDDLRQETNNVINKFNGWLSFWLAILALVGGLIPFVIQLAMQADQKEKVERISEEQKREFRKLHEEVKTQLQELDREKKQMEKSRIFTEITRLTYTLISCRENVWGVTAIDRMRFWDEIFIHLSKDIDRLFDNIGHKEALLQKDNAFYLQMVLVQLYTVYNTYLPTQTVVYKTRQVVELMGIITELLTHLSEKGYSPSQLEDDLYELRYSMKCFNA